MHPPYHNRDSQPLIDDVSIRALAKRAEIITKTMVVILQSSIQQYGECLNNFKMQDELEPNIGLEEIKNYTERATTGTTQALDDYVFETNVVNRLRKEAAEMNAGYKDAQESLRTNG